MGSPGRQYLPSESQLPSSLDCNKINNARVIQEETMSEDKEAGATQHQQHLTTHHQQQQQQQQHQQQQQQAQHLTTHQQQAQHLTTHQQHQQAPQHLTTHQAATLVSMQASQQVGQQQATMAQVMQQAPQAPTHSPHGAVGVTTSMSQQSPQFYVQTSLASGMPAPPAIAPAPGPSQSNTNTTMSALHHHLTPTLTHPGVSPSPITQFPQQVQVIQSGIPGGPYFQQLYHNGQGQIIMPGNLTLQTAAGMNTTSIQPNTINGINQPLQVITAGKPFPGQIAPHMLTAAAGKTGVLQAGGQGYSPAAIPTSGNQTLVISQLPLGMINSQQHNILPPHSTTHKQPDVQKQSITWATPGTLHSSTLLAAQNQPIFIRGAQPGQDNVFISNPQPQPMQTTNSLLPPLCSMQQQQQHSGQVPTHPKPRSALELPANIQPKTPLRPTTLLPSTHAHIRPSVSTQTANAHQLANTHIPTPPRAQNKIRGKNNANRNNNNNNNNNNIAIVTTQQQQQQMVVAAQNNIANITANNAGTQVFSVASSANTNNSNVTTTATIPQTLSVGKVINQQQPSVQPITSLTHNTKSGVPMTPPTAPLPHTTQAPPGFLPPLVRIPKPLPPSPHQAPTNHTPTPPPPVLVSSVPNQTSTSIQSIANSQANSSSIPASSGSILASSNSNPAISGTISASSGSVLANTGSILANTGSIPPNTGSIPPNICSIPPNTCSIPPNTCSIPPNTSSIPANTCSILATSSSLPGNTSSIMATTGSVTHTQAYMGPQTYTQAPTQTQSLQQQQQQQQQQQLMQQSQSTLEPPTLSPIILTPKTEATNSSTNSANCSKNSSIISPSAPMLAERGGGEGGVGGTSKKVVLPSPPVLPSPSIPVHPQQQSTPAVNGVTASESGEVPEKTPPDPSQPPTPAPAPPKALVKPQVLTHVIEGFVIHEASEPFPVSRSSLLTEISTSSKPTRPTNTPTAAISPSPTAPSHAVGVGVGAVVGGQAEKENQPDKDLSRKRPLDQTSPKADTAKCEFCGKTDLRSKFKRSKRFCSTACAKRYNVGCSKRIGLFRMPQEGDDPPDPTHPSPHKRPRTTPTEDDSIDDLTSTPDTQNQSINSLNIQQDGDNFMEVDNEGIGAPSSELSGNSADSPSKNHRVDILKWTVKDVVEFIENLPGCKEYAEDFALQEIDGQALMLLKADHLMSAMSMKLGPALKICAKIESMRGDRKET
ncbi:hypothetical protein Pcinc_004873 [Petrolisthes cinctipes]|uniref:Polyhomeotic-like protein 2 n=1 Tax=Petrolisthes cinctipes TaxID=88211 RepID=A0AAE1KZP3_PETCI|nr:hypothetical protein Pcinc_004873 [Petrolisthes cinctipes]